MKAHIISEPQARANGDPTAYSDDGEIVILGPDQSIRLGLSSRQAEQLAWDILEAMEGR